MLRVAHFLHRLAFTIGVSIIGNGSLPFVAGAEEQRLGLPVDCKLGIDCFVQQMPDIDPGQATLDPLCGQATYQGHTGWDIRLRTLGEIARDFPVVAVADGTVSRVRDGIPDKIFDAANDRHRLHDLECGNGVLIDHQSGLSSQYCHLKNGSLAVRSGMLVRKGERIGSIGSSGVAEFPHVHLSVRQDGKLVEPLTGKALRDESPVCGDLSGSLLDAASKQVLVQAPVTILDIGLANAPPELGNLVRWGGPALATGGGNSTIAWVWAINVDQGSRFRIKLVGPGETTLIDHATTALPRRKANYLAYVGRKVGVKAGTYQLSVEITNDEKRIALNNRTFTISE
ncbi:M23 family metallopeptidase [Bradyrhizobium sp. AUGA SZCCT0160]|uniref:M23 family metallopeptidase n=1 Tax=Bradyrhizobium sp. AUGA SZCCT0160 TaxID=2807662 RepID=UPI001BA816F0|nr:M23 family metallopeptidase [Bradyrhizobium sp. AUGA SZCCT0160]MBR1187290.1 M23 family metallopeptidase [Bradyrhizobium sp. AUGA SZCCT0160]